MEGCHYRTRVKESKEKFEMYQAVNRGGGTAN